MIEHFQCDIALINKYISTGIILGDRTNYLYVGMSNDFKRILNDFEKLEKEYAKRGYKPISIKDFIDRAKGSKELEGVRIKREVGEELIYYAEILKKSLSLK